jgi:hypothetical protein
MKWFLELESSPGSAFADDTQGCAGDSTDLVRFSVDEALSLFNIPEFIKWTASGEAGDSLEGKRSRDGILNTL